MGCLPTYDGIRFNSEAEVQAYLNKEQKFSFQISPNSLKEAESKTSAITQEQKSLEDIIAEKISELQQTGELEIDCSNATASEGLRNKFTKGAKWELVKDLKGYPSHADGGVDIAIKDNNFYFKNSAGNEIKAAHGLVISSKNKSNEVKKDTGNLENLNSNTTFVSENEVNIFKDGYRPNIEFATNKQLLSLSSPLSLKMKVDEFKKQFELINSIVDELWKN